jgi:hypothetical protein
MAYEMVPESFEIAQNAGADLSAKLYFFAKVDTDEDIILCGDGQAALGVIREANVENKPVTVQTGGVAKVSAGAAFNAGVLVASDTNGQAVLATTGEYAMGMAMQAAGAINEIVSIRLGPYGRVA